MPRIDLHNRVIAITGASSGIGAATAIAAAQAGMDVALCARRLDKLNAVAQRVRDSGRRALTFQCDVTDPAQVQAFIDAIVAEFGRLDVLYANAGYGLLKSVEETTDAEYREIFETNFYGTLNAVRAALPALRSTADGRASSSRSPKPSPDNSRYRGHIVICSSAISEVAVPFFGAYAATKSAQDSIAGSLRAELAHENIFVTSVHPIGTKSEFFQEVARRDGQGEMSSNTPDFATQTPEHVARRIVASLRRPRAEVWPSVPARWGLALLTALPWLAALVMRKYAAKLRKNLPAKQS